MTHFDIRCVKAVGGHHSVYGRAMSCGEAVKRVAVLHIVSDPVCRWYGTGCGGEGWFDRRDRL